MKRLHVSVAVSDLDKSIRFYSTLFGKGPTILKSDYAKWLLEDPRVNFSISDRGAAKGLDHLGIQVDDDGELAEVAGRLARAGESLFEQKATTCCYARSNKAWVHDPEGIAWETFHTFGESTVYGEDRAGDQAGEIGSAACCAPAGAHADAAACCGDESSRSRMTDSAGQTTGVAKRPPSSGCCAPTT
jgi:catechol 2,3-dioxygenase-like lactoylglutathione lyase family enzyme